MDKDWITVGASVASAFSALAILALSYVQFNEIKSLNKIQKRLAKIDLKPSVNLEFNYNLGILNIKNSGRMQFFFETAVVNKVEPSFSNETPDGKRLLAVNGTFPLKFKVEDNPRNYPLNIPTDTFIHGKMALSDLDGNKYELGFKVKIVMLYISYQEKPDVITNAWIESVKEVEKFVWES